ncbi:hypothetical protein DLAC_08004 [Tieghemostelium lacteum]|uniref:FNIP repeat-containing protein n=1 Tax=Tieghemostelium lacteum TaxID=361077 RepID=A0A151ZAY7_TIELA|nr:hypothetical protein DLAC_08004 [Tieghemostelium lacteum]|eukprot:KYQ91098.1 hypothetical protein DLAC_08004 [Tieghemostelium lacteum]
MSFYNLQLILVRYITELLDNDIDTINWLSSCKHFYDFRDQITFDKFPNYYYSINVNKIQANSTTLPKRFKNLYIKPQDSIINSINDIFSNYGIDKCLYQQSSDQTKLLRLPDSTSISKLELSFHVIDELSIPNTVKELVLNHVQFEWRYIPESVTSLFVDSLTIDGPLKVNLKKLVFTSIFNQEIRDDTFPPSITYLDLGVSFNYNISIDILPPNLQHLILGNSFNSSVLSLPTSLVTLHLPSFTPPDLGIYPVALQELKLQNLKCINSIGLLSNLIKLELKQFDEDLAEGVLPLTLQELILPKFSKVLHPGSIPHSVTHLTLYFYHTINNSCALPLSLKSLVLVNQNQALIPSTILNDHKFERLLARFSLHNIRSIDQLPNTLKYLELGMNAICEISEGVLPETLEEIVFTSYFDQAYNKRLYTNPIFVHLKNLRILKTCWQVKETLEDNLPEGLKEFHLTTIDYDLLQSLPKGLEILICKNAIIDPTMRYTSIYDFTVELGKGLFPPSLLKLDLGAFFKATLTEGSLPPLLESIRFNSQYHQKFQENTFPSTLKRIYISEKCLKNIESMLPPYCKINFI